MLKKIKHFIYNIINCLHFNSNLEPYVTMSYIFYMLNILPYGLSMLGRCHKNIKNDLISFFVSIERERERERELGLWK